MISGALAARYSRARARPTSARFTRAVLVAAATVAPSALAAFSDWVNLDIAESVISATVSGWPNVRLPSALAVLIGTPEHQFSANDRYMKPARASISGNPASAVVSGASVRYWSAAKSVERRPRLSVRNQPVMVP